jgi:hypothetical protein
MNELNAHYGLLLGLNDSWEVVEVNVDPPLAFTLRSLFRNSLSGSESNRVVK